MAANKSMDNWGEISLHPTSRRYNPMYNWVGVHLIESMACACVNAMWKYGQDRPGQDRYGNITWS